MCKQNDCQTLILQLFVWLLCFNLLFMPAVNMKAFAGQHQDANFDSAVNFYNAADYKAALASLDKAAQSSPDERLIPYFKGLSFLQLGHQAQAIASFERFLILDPGGEKADEVRPLLTQLKKNYAKDAAKKIISAEMKAPPDPDAANTVAVYSPVNLGMSQYDHISRGLAAMLIYDLHQTQMFTVLERVEIQALFDEIALSRTELVSSETTIKAGQLLSAGRVIPGTYQMDEKQLELQAQTVNTIEGKVIDTARASGPSSDFWDLEKILVFFILEDLGVKKDKIPTTILDKVEQIHTKSYAAFDAYSRGLVATDLEDYAEAKQQFQQSLKEDPDFDLAKAALIALPLAAVGTMTLTNSLDNIGEALIGGSRVSSSALLLAGAGAAGVVGAVALGGGGGSGGSAPPTEEVTNWVITNSTKSIDGTCSEDDMSNFLSLVGINIITSSNHSSIREITESGYVDYGGTMIGTSIISWEGSGTGSKLIASATINEDKTQLAGDREIYFEGCYVIQSFIAVRGD